MMDFDNFTKIHTHTHHAFLQWAFLFCSIGSYGLSVHLIDLPNFLCVCVMLSEGGERCSCLIWTGKLVHTTFKSHWTSPDARHSSWLRTLFTENKMFCCPLNHIEMTLFKGQPRSGMPFEKLKLLFTQNSFHQTDYLFLNPFLLDYSFWHLSIVLAFKLYMTTHLYSTHTQHPGRWTLFLFHLMFKPNKKGRVELGVNKPIRFRPIIFCYPCPEAVDKIRRCVCGVFHLWPIKRNACLLIHQTESGGGGCFLFWFSKSISL